MRGYVVIDRPELKVREYELYTAYYCGICKSIGRRFGQLPRLALTYDAAFAAIILAALDDTSETFEKEGCIVHPVNKKTFVVNSSAVDYSADLMLMLSYGKLDDDVRDDGRLLAAVLKKLSQKTYERLSDTYTEFENALSNGLAELSRLEKNNSPSLDDTSEAFGKILGSGLAHYLDSEDIKATVLYNLGFNLGRWIYLMDAAEDIEEDIEKNHYNPLISRFEFNINKESPDEFRNRIREPLELNLFHYLGEASKAMDLLEIKRNKGIVNNVIYLGLRNKTEEVLCGKTRNKNRKDL